MYEKGNVSSYANNTKLWYIIQVILQSEAESFHKLIYVKEVLIK